MRAKAINRCAARRENKGGASRIMRLSQLSDRRHRILLRGAVVGHGCCMA